MDRKKEIFLSSNLKYLRIKKGNTQSDLAKFVDKSITMISYWEKGIREPGAVDLGLLSEYYNVNVEDLLFKNLISENENISKKYNIKSNIKNLVNKICEYNQILNTDDINTIDFILNNRIKDTEDENVKNK